MSCACSEMLIYKVISKVASLCIMWLLFNYTYLNLHLSSIDRAYNHPSWNDLKIVSIYSSENCSVSAAVKNRSVLFRGTYNNSDAEHQSTKHSCHIYPRLDTLPSSYCFLRSRMFVPSPANLFINSF